MSLVKLHYILLIVELSIVFCFADNLGLLSHEKCRQVSTSFDECQKNLTQALIDNIVHGVPELGIPVMDPLVMTDMNLTAAGTSIASQLYSVTFRHLIVTGLSNVKVTQVNLSSPLARITVRTPELRVTTPYEGRYTLLLRLFGTGDLAFYFTNTTLILNVQHSEDLTSGDTMTSRVIQVNDLSVTSNFESSSVFLEGKDQQGQQGPFAVRLVNRVLGSNSADLARWFLPFLHRALSDQLLAVARDLVKDIPHVVTLGDPHVPLSDSHLTLSDPQVTLSDSHVTLGDPHVTLSDPNDDLKAPLASKEDVKNKDNLKQLSVEIAQGTQNVTSSVSSENVDALEEKIQISYRFDPNTIN